ncbi:lipin, putative [Ixodes scapularis]|uniref:phosphatidate phosphatase n=1 Tax=Ixodes scapularis TaxID=6945 RepID=B7PQS9_IXOSC|nr:lipin, putative [Ixodes scapularis]|eukprot:XP_002436121.1 lipin, putative [Ixodes scapularis]
MNYIGRIITNVREFCNEINSATLTGAIDVVVVEQPDGSFATSPFHVRFGKIGVLRSREKIVDIEINGKPVNIHMKLGESGEAFFVEEVTEESVGADVPGDLPIARLPRHWRGTAQAQGGTKSATTRRGVPAAVQPMPGKRQRRGRRRRSPDHHWLDAGHAHPLDVADLTCPSPLPPSNSQDERDERLSLSPVPGEDSAKPPSAPSSQPPQGKRRRKKKHSVHRRSRCPPEDAPLHARVPQQGATEDTQQDIFQMDSDFDDDRTVSIGVASPSSSSPSPQRSPLGPSLFLSRSVTMPSNLSAARDEWQQHLMSTPKRLSVTFPGGGGFHPYSDGDITPPHRWGPSVLGGVLSFMKPTKKQKEDAPPTAAQEGIFLDDLDPRELDPEVAALYFPKFSILLCLLLGLRKLNKAIVCVPSAEFECILSRLPKVAKSHLDPKYERLRKRFNAGPRFPRVARTMTQNPETVRRCRSRPTVTTGYYTWSAIAPHLLSLAMFQRPLPEKTLHQLTDAHMPKKKKKSTLSWWSWGRAENPLPVALFRMVSKETKEDASTSSEAETSDTRRPPEHRKINREKRSFFCDKYKKSLRLSSDEIASLNLKSGPNEAVFSVTTAYQGTTRCMCHIYLWKHDDKIVISDIDGTITKSDVLGHILPILGKDWAQSGVAKLFTKIHHNGYQFLYLSARAIGQAHITREYLRSIRQGDLWLPDGPLLLSPTSLINAFHKEVIEKKPEEFKISCLRDIQALFNVTGNPFYAGFGNKINDTLAYRAVGIPVSRIFTINHRGELKLELMQNFLSSYNCLSDVVDHVFPPIHPGSCDAYCNGRMMTFPACEEFTSFTYWRDPIAPVEIEIEEPAKPAPK